MLTLKEPLEISCGKLSLSDTFGERIRSGYSLMAASVMPQELFFLLSAPPDAPVIEGGMTSLAIDNRSQNTQNLLLNIVNNVVNRVLLEQRGELTYQDAVYLEIALSKLGITNISDFMKEVREERQQSLNIYRLLEQYQANTELVTRHIEARPELRHIMAAPSDEKPDSREKIRLYLHEEIYRRLQTAALYREVASYSHSATENLSIINRRELITAEQSRISSFLSLHEHRSHITQVSGDSLIFRQNRFETGEGMPLPASETQIIERVCAASLAKLVSNVMIARIRQTLNNENIWYDIGGAVRNTSENTIKRFMMFHEDKTFLRSETSYDEAYQNRLYTAEMNSLTRLASLIRQEFQINRYAADTIHLSAEKALSQERAESPAAVRAAQSELLRELHSVIHQRTARFTAERTAVPPAARAEFFTKIRETLPPVIETLDETYRISETGDITQNLYTTGDEIITLGSAEYTPGEPERARLEHQTVPPEQDETLLMERLSEIDRQNRERVEHFRETLATRNIETIKPPAPDKSRIHIDALRAIDQPESVIAEAVAAPPPAARIHPEIEAALSQSDEATRRIMETVMLYERDPEKAISMGLLHPGDPSALRSEVQAVEAGARAYSAPEQELIHIPAETVTEVERTVYERLAEQSEARTARVREQSEQQQKISFVHRKTETSSTEEIAGLVQNTRQTTQTVTHETTKQITENHAVETRINKLEQELRTKTAEDITEMINKTLRRQIGVISEQVYGHLEKKLQSERARRGR